MSSDSVDRQFVVHGTEIGKSDPVHVRRQKLARITLDSMVQFVGLLDAQGTVLEINKVALDAVGLTLADVEGKRFWTTFWWQVSEEANQGIRDAIARGTGRVCPLGYTALCERGRLGASPRLAGADRPA
jgi:PAS domain S-box-containing protein